MTEVYVEQFLAADLDAVAARIQSGEWVGWRRRGRRAR